MLTRLFRARNRLRVIYGLAPAEDVGMSGATRMQTCTPGHRRRTRTCCPPKWRSTSPPVPHARSFRDETLAMEGRLKAALELPLHRFRKPAETSKAAPRRFALAASVVLALLVGGGAWLFRPQPALAGEVVEHVKHEPGSWQAHEPVSAGSAGGCARESRGDVTTRASR